MFVKTFICKQVYNCFNKELIIDLIINLFKTNDNFAAAIGAMKTT